MYVCAYTTGVVSCKWLSCGTLSSMQMAWVWTSPCLVQAQAICSLDQGFFFRSVCLPLAMIFPSPPLCKTVAPLLQNSERSPVCTISLSTCSRILLHKILLHSMLLYQALVYVCVGAYILAVKLFFLYVYLVSSLVSFTWWILLGPSRFS